MLSNDPIKGSDGELTTRQDQTLLLSGNDDVGYSINEGKATGATVKTSQGSHITLSGSEYNLNDLEVKGTLTLSEDSQVQVVSIKATGAEAQMENRNSMTVAEAASFEEGSQLINKGSIEFKEGSTLKEGSFMENTAQSRVVLGEDSTFLIESGSSFKNNGEITGGSLVVNGKKNTLSGAGTYTNTNIDIKSGALWNIGNSPGIVHYNGGNAHVGNGAQLHFSLDGRDQGQYSQIRLEGGATLSFDTNAVIIISMNEGMAQSILLDVTLGRNFDLIDSTEGTLTGWADLSGQVTLEIEGYDTTGSQFTLGEDGSFSIDSLIIETGALDRGLTSMTGNALWGSTMNMRQFVSSMSLDTKSLGSLSLNKKSRVWATYIGGFNTLEDGNGTTGADYQNNGYALGVDTIVGKNNNLGIAFGQSFGDVTANSSSGKVEQNALMFGLYGNISLFKTEQSTWSLAMSAAYGRDDNDMTLDSLKGSWTTDSWMVSALMKGLYTPVKGTQLMRYFGLEWNTSLMNSFNTSGAKDLHYDSDSLSSLRAKAGVACYQSLSDKLTGYIDASILPELNRSNPES